ncbi:MAG TPA: HEAT repeat domain-containing protein, partial [Gemmataceae bacterium]
DRGVKLAALLIRHGPAVALAWNRLGQRYPIEVADVLLDAGEQSAISLARSAHRLDTPRLLALLERQPATLTPTWLWLRRLPPNRRGEIYRHCDRLWRDADGCLDPQSLRYLPRDPRRAEGRRHLELPALATRPQARLAYAAFLSWEEARGTTEPFLNHPEAELRSAALQALIGAVRFERGHRGELLTRLRGRRHEQDPVRCIMLASLAQLPPGIWKTENLEDLGQILRDALSAADLSYATAAQAQGIIVALLPFHPDWSASWIVTLVRERGQIHFGSLEQRLTDADVRRIAPALAPVLKAWQTREREAQLLGLGQSLGRRLGVFETLMAILRRLLRDTATQWVAGTILQIIARHQRAELKTLVPELIREDPSWVTQTPVLQLLHRRRQDLLTPFLGRRAYKGRFSTGRTRYVLPLSDGFFRWTSAQQTEFARTLEEITHVKDKMRDVPTVLRGITQMAALPALGSKRLVELASDERPAVQEAALRALGKLDAGQGVQALLDALGDDRSRVAIYALRKALLAMPAAHALQLLKVVPLQKVTVAKEYVRLLGEMPSVEAFRALGKLDEQTLHRDVRVALLRALWGHLEHAEAWEILNHAVESPDPALMTAVVRIPADRLGEQAQRRLIALLARVLNHPDATVRTQVLQRCLALPVPDREQVLLPRLLAALRASAPDERIAAAHALFAICRSADAARLADGIRETLSNRRALLAMVEALSAAMRGQHSRLMLVGRAVLDVLAEDPLTAHLRVELAVGMLSWADLADVLERMAASGELHAEALTAGVQAMAAWARRPDRADLERLETRLAPHSDERLRRLALAALTVEAKLPGGWSDARLERLRIYRRDRSPLVAAAAQFTLPAESLPSDAPAAACQWSQV